MKRTPLRRLTPLRSKSELRRKTPLRGNSTLRRNRTIVQRSAIAKAKRSTRARPDEPLAAWCVAAVAGVCTGRAEHRHHILRRSAGGGDEAANTADLCGACHGHIHANPAWSYEHGWLKKRTA